MTKKYSRLTGDPEAGFNLSWGAIFAGVATFIALMLTFSTISSAIGFGMLDFTQSNVLNNADTGVTIWSIIALILSFLGAGFVSGIASRRIGLLHGFVTWASSLIASVLLFGYIASSILSFAGSVAGGAVDVATDAVGAAGSAVTSAFDSLASNIDFDGIQVDTSELGDNAEQILEDTEIPELQPEYLQDTLQGAGAIAAQAGQEIAVNPENADQIISNAFESVSQEVQSIVDAADEDAIANAVENNTDMTQAEAQQATQNFIQGTQQTVNEAQDALDQAQTQLEETRQQVDQEIQQLQSDVAQGATEASDTASNVSIWLFIGLLLSAILSSLAGLFGSNMVRFSPKEGSM